MKRARDNRGITLVEVLISMAVLSIGILGLLQAFPLATRTERSLEMEAIANHLAQEKMESFQALAYEDIAIGTLESGVAADADITSPFYIFTRTTTVAYVDQNLATSQTDLDLKRISITISWPRPSGAGTSTTSLVTLRSK
ncbi:MAG: prepilin-type N-terminal cleavage/methylation domain-containing protein [Parcubacteria group bacterium]|nr:prepilin-type N-terminal cleavage/methylation domain-containing protein [Parcubacteria group bacterium]